MTASAHSDPGLERAWLTLIRAPKLGPARIRQLTARLGGARAVLDTPPTVLESLGVPTPALAALTDPDDAAIERDLAWLAEAGHHLLTADSPHYPPLLATLPDAPAALFVDGDPEVLASPQLAIVGSRNPTATGAETAHAFARHLASRGLTITSGLALGIDSAAHRGALDAVVGNTTDGVGGATVAVLGSGIDVIYPAANADLARRIAGRGAVVSELPPGHPPRRGNFPGRNRVISGLSVGTLVVEAAVRSGSLITARLATAQGREVFAIPGSIHSPLSRGCHRLIREGAKLVESADHILEELAALLGALVPDAPAEAAEPAADDESYKPASDRNDPEYDILLGALGYEPTPVDTLVARTGLTANAVSSMLLILELKGQVSLAAGGYVRAATR